MVLLIFLFRFRRKSSVGDGRVAGAGCQSVNRAFWCHNLWMISVKRVRIITTVNGVCIKCADRNLPSHRQNVAINLNKFLYGA